MFSLACASCYLDLFSFLEGFGTVELESTFTQSRFREAEPGNNLRVKARQSHRICSNPVSGLVSKEIAL